VFHEHRGFGFLNELVDNTFGRSRLAGIFHATSNFLPHTRSFLDWRFVGMFLVVGDPQTFDFTRVHYPKRMSLQVEKGGHTTNIMATLDQRDLVKCVRKFRTLDDELKTVNTRVSKLREDKKFVESEMSDILRRSAFQGISKLEIPDDGSFIKVQRPETWGTSRGRCRRRNSRISLGVIRVRWTVCSSILWTARRRMVSKEFSFKRIVNMDDNNDDAHSRSGCKPSRLMDRRTKMNCGTFFFGWRRFSEKRAYCVKITKHIEPYILPEFCNSVYSLSSAVPYGRLHEKKIVSEFVSLHTHHLSRGCQYFRRVCPFCDIITANRTRYSQYC